jgi:WD repeat-containing protein 68
MSNPASYDSNRRSAIFGRTPEELHIPSTGLINPNLSRQPLSQDYPTTPDASAAAQVPSINVHSSQSQQHQLQQQQPPQYGGNPGNSSSALPGSLTPGNQHRPPAVSTNTAPSVIPTLQHQSPAQQASHRTSMINSHAHSRSSPAGFDQSVYKQHGGMEGSKYPSSPGGYAPQTPQGSKYSPLGLADIRPPGEHLLGDSLMSPGSLPYNGETQVPTNSNYVAPWPIYAVDWCKWPMTGSSSSFGGKLALGSYLEDNHNYVRSPS